MKRIILLILCAVMLSAFITACGASDNSTDYYWDPPSDGSSDNAASSGDGASSDNNGINKHGVDYEAAFAAFAPDTVMLVAGDYTVKWSELYFSLRSVLNSLISNYGELPDLSELMPEGIPYYEAVLNYAIDNAMVYRAIEYGAKKSGVTLSEDDHDYLKEEYGSIVDSYGGMDEFLNTLWEEDGISNFDLFYYLYSIPYLAELTFKELYGADGALIPDEEAAAQTASAGYIMAKHILRLKTEDGDDTPMREAEDILELLDNYDGEDFESFFDSMMYEYSEDAGGLSSFPNGYLFQYGDMVPEFYDACIALEAGSYSGLVETTYGFHIVYKLPVNYDEIPMYNYNQYDYRPLRGIVAQEMFNDNISEWVDLHVPEHTAEFDSMDITQIFKKMG